MKSKSVNIEKICVAGNNSELKKLRDFVMEKAKSFGFNEKDAYQITLAVDEACSNLIRHAFKFDSSFFICIEIIACDNEFTVKILDKSNSFNPLDVESPNMEEYRKNFKHGGLGIHIMRSVMDAIQYFPSNPNNPSNELRLVKFLN